MHIIIYTKQIKQVSGVQTFEKNFINTFKDRHQIQYVFDIMETNAKLIEGITYTQNHGQALEAEICIWSSINHRCPGIKAKKYIQVYHTDPALWPVIWPKEDKVDIHVAVGQAVKKSLEENFSIKARHIPNILNLEDTPKCLRLITASRIAMGKGFESRMGVLAEKLTNAKIPFVWEIYGTGDMGFMEQVKKEYAKYPTIRFMGPVDDIKPYLKGMDFLVQLSDNEGFCYAMYEALSVNVAVIATPFDEAVKRHNSHYDIWITGFDMENVDDDWLEAIHLWNDERFEFIKPFNNAKEKWSKILI